MQMTVESEDKRKRGILPDTDKLEMEFNDGRMTRTTTITQVHDVVHGAHGVHGVHGVVHGVHGVLHGIEGKCVYVMFEE